jgi:hypothetical protein
VDFDPAYGDSALLAGAQMLRRGDWQPAMILLRETGNDWDRKTHRVTRLAHDLKAHDTISAWVAAEPDNPDAHSVNARALVNKAWAVRGNSYAKQVGQGKWKGFFEHLNAADGASPH